MHLQVTPTTNMAVEQVRIEQIALQPQLMTDTVLAQELTKPTATQPQNTTSTIQDKAQSKRHQLATPHTINMGVEQVVIRQTLMAQPHLMTNTEERQVHSKQIPQVEPPNTTATAEKSVVLSNKSLWGSNGIFNIINQLNIMLITNLKHKFV